MKTGILDKPKIFKRGGKWQICHLLLPAKTFSIELASAATKYCQRMNDSKKAVSKAPMYQYQHCSSADVSIDGVALDWAIVEQAEEVLGRVKVNAVAGRCGLILSEKTKMATMLSGDYFYGDVVITNAVRAAHE